MKTYLLLLHLIFSTYKKKKKYVNAPFNKKNEELSLKLIRAGILKGFTRKGSRLILFLKFNNSIPALKYLTTIKVKANTKATLQQSSKNIVTSKNYLYLSSQGLIISNRVYHRQPGKLLAIFY
jgi:hypothetical protein